MTGGSSDIAAAVLDELDKRTDEKITIFAQYLSHEIDTDRANLDIRPIRADLSDAADVDSFVDSIRESGLTPTHIFHLAAVPYDYVKIKAWDEESVGKQMRVGLYSFASICRAFVPVMAKEKRGDIVVMLTSFSPWTKLISRIPGRMSVSPMPRLVFLVMTMASRE